MIKRHKNWEEKLERYIKDSASNTFIRGETDCVPFVSDCVETYTGAALWANFKGKYSSDKEAFKLIKKHPEGFLGLVKDELSKFGLKQKLRTLAKRGDICFIRVNKKGELHEALAICYGQYAVSPDKKGVKLISMQHAVAAWEISF